jgi:hypothetical protein
VRHWLTRRVKAHIFICYLAYLHLSWMEMLLKEKGLDMSARKALQKLESIYRVTLTDTHTGMSTMRTVPLTKEQENYMKHSTCCHETRGEFRIFIIFKAWIINNFTMSIIAIILFLIISIGIFYLLTRRKMSIEIQDEDKKVLHVVKAQYDMNNLDEALHVIIQDYKENYSAISELIGEASK